jgi:hypothetical protein
MSIINFNGHSGRIPRQPRTREPLCPGAGLRKQKKELADSLAPTKFLASPRGPSARLRIDPSTMLRTSPSTTLRTSPFDYAQDKFTNIGVKARVKSLILPFLNLFNPFKTYLKGLSPDQIPD